MAPKEENRADGEIALALLPEVGHLISALGSDRYRSRVGSLTRLTMASGSWASMKQNSQRSSVAVVRRIIDTAPWFRRTNGGAAVRSFQPDALERSDHDFERDGQPQSRDWEAKRAKD